MSSPANWVDATQQLCARTSPWWSKEQLESGIVYDDTDGLVQDCSISIANDRQHTGDNAVLL